MKFEWDRNKERTNIQKHGITFEQASYVFADPFALNLYDSEHSENEDRWVLLGKSLNRTLLLVIHTFRDNDNIEFVRIISARKATKRETQFYNKRCLK
ncbi:MAG: BrnT family toxin [Victivallales bacterium]|nr:BrnT family toxin [Victivallales bacterium]